MYLDTHGYDIPDLRMIDTTVCRLRQKLKRFRIDIETLYGKGIAPAIRAHAAVLIDREHEKDRAARAARSFDDGWIEV